MQLPIISLSMVIILIGTISFYPVLYAGFAFNADDSWMVFNNPSVFSHDLQTIIDYFTSVYKGQYSPVNTLYYSTIYGIFGLEPFWFHLGNIVIHILNALLVWRLIFLLSMELNYKLRLVVSLLVAILFLVHPIQVEAVAWISASKVVLYSFFYLLAILSYINFYIKNSGKWYGLAIFFFFLSFGAKEQAVILPISLFLIDYVMGRNLLNKNVIMEKLPFLFIALVCGLSTIYIQDVSGFSDIREGGQYHEFWIRFILSGYSLTEYLFGILIPFKSARVTLFPISPGEMLPLRFYIYPVIVLFFGYYLFRVLKNRVLIFGVLFFIVNLLLSIHLVPMARSTMVADRYVYLSSLGVFFPMIWLIVNNRLFLNLKPKVGNWLLAVIFSVAILSLVLITNTLSQLRY